MRAGTDGTTSAIFTGVEIVDVEDNVEVRIHFFFGPTTGAGEVRRAWRGTTDGITWSAVTEFGAAYTSTVAWNWSTAYSTPSASYRQIEYGYNIRNVSGTKREAVLLDTIFESRGV